MKELDRFTSERLESLCDYRPNRVTNLINFREIAALARIALAARRAEPDWYVVITSVGVWQARYKTRSEAESHIKPWHKDFWIKELYTTPQLNSPEIPDGWKLVPIEPTQNMVDAHISGMQLAGFSRAYRDMLATAPEPQNQQQNIPQGWINCSDQMPEDDTLCLGVDECGVIWTMHFDDGEFRADTGDVDDLKISHWMPLPAAPEKENG
ncbi:DUF551 domain-containing protein [Yersinia enterocolitica]